MFRVETPARYGGNWIQAHICLFHTLAEAQEAKRVLEEHDRNNEWVAVEEEDGNGAQRA